MNIPRKTIDGLACHLDLKHHGIRKELTLQEKYEKLYIPPPMYNLTNEKKYVRYGFLSSVKVFDEYFSNNRTLVSLKEKKLYMSHDCYALI